MGNAPRKEDTAFRLRNGSTKSDFRTESAFVSPARGFA
jgi:hypothetical protein